MNMYCNNCGSKLPKGSKFCKKCGQEIVSDVEEQDFKKKSDELEPNNHIGLGGWLVLVGLGLIATPFIYGSSLLSYLPLFNNTYDIPGYMLLLVVEFLIIFISFLISLYLLYLYFKKSVKFPKFYIMFLIATSIWVIVDALLVASLTPQTAQEQKVLSDALSQSYGTIGRALITSIIWVTYMLKSKRVKATFVKE